MTLVLGGWPSKIEVIWVPGAYIMLLLMEEIRRSPVEVSSLSHYFTRCLLHPRRCRISSINSISMCYCRKSGLESRNSSKLFVKACAIRLRSGHRMFWVSDGECIVWRCCFVRWSTIKMDLKGVCVWNKCPNGSCHLYDRVHLRAARILVMRTNVRHDNGQHWKTLKI